MTMNLEEIRSHLRDELIPDHRERGKYICPLCGSGSSAGHHDGAFSIARDGIHGKCFSCGFYGDIFDLVSQRDGVDPAEATKILAERYGSGIASAPAAKPQRPAREPEPVQPHDFSAHISACHSSLKGSPGEEYLRQRGFTDETMERFRLGFGFDSLRQPCIVMPHDRKGSYYTTRAISDATDRKHDKPAGIPAILFNGAALYQDQPCFVVESQLCAISVMQEGGSAVALSGIAGRNLLLNELDRKAPTATLILALDNDQPGRDAQAKLAEALSERQLPYLEMNIAGECKDPNELLQKDPATLRQNIAAVIAVANATRETIKQNELDEYEAKTTSASFSEFEDYLSANGNRPPIPTGFPSLDKILNGGLTAGLYIMGAISSLGKTSWMLNIADNIAAAGRDVLYFSLEMSRHELMAKSISRISFGLAGEQEDMMAAFSTFEVLNSRGSCHLTIDQNIALQKAMVKYRETIGKHMWIFSGIGSIGTDDVTKAVEEHIRITGRTPVVFIDYLQILRPEDPRSSDKQNTDRAVVKLKTMSATYDIPVFCISSLNRANYNTEISMLSFKESGSVEYGSDVLIGLQLYGISTVSKVGKEEKIAEIVKAAETDPQVRLEVRVLKNRNGQRGGSGQLLFDKKYNSFTDVPKGFTPVSESLPFDRSSAPVLRL